MIQSEVLWWRKWLAATFLVNSRTNAGLAAETEGRIVSSERWPLLPAN